MAPAAKRLMRALWRVLPRCRLSYNAGKLVTRSWLRPEQHSHRIRTDFAGRIPMDLDLASFVSNDLYCLDDHYESITLQLWRKLARQVASILDIGSHIGTFALVAADANPNARVIAVEAEPTNFAQLQRHAVGYPHLVAVHAAIADRPASMWFCPDAANDGGGCLRTEPTDDPGCFAVKACTLSEVCATHGLSSVDLMKLDVEGFEHTLLTCDDSFWDTYAPTHLIVEMTIDKRDPTRSNEVFHAMERRGYSARRIQGLYAVPFGKPYDLANWHFQRSTLRSS